MLANFRECHIRIILAMLYLGRRFGASKVQFSPVDAKAAVLPKEVVILIQFYAPSIVYKGSGFDLLVFLSLCIN